MLLVLIVACEISFWVVLLLGLSVRYVLGRRRVGGALLVLVPMIDLVLLVATVLHLRSGAPADFTDGLAAVYLGCTITFGPTLVSRMDARFAHRFAGGTKPARSPKYGADRTAYEWRLFGRAATAWAIACTLLLGGVALVGGARQGAVLLALAGQMTLILLIWLIWAVTYTIWPAKPKPGDTS